MTLLRKAGHRIHHSFLRPHLVPRHHLPSSPRTENKEEKEEKEKKEKKTKQKHNKKGTT